MTTIYDRLFQQQAGRAEGNQFDLAGTDEEGNKAKLPQILNPPKYAPEIDSFEMKANGLAIARQLLGPDAVSHGDHAILKPGPSDAATPWHQDEAYWAPDLDYSSISIWVPLQDVNEEMGCMQFIPGSHKLEVLPHHHINNDPRIHGLEVDNGFADARRAVACPLPAGGATIHSSRTFHYTAPNCTNRPRRAYIMTFGVPPRKRAMPREFPWLVEQKTARSERAAKAAAAGKDVGPQPGVTR